MSDALSEFSDLRSPPRRPADFDAFWKRTLDELAAFPSDWERLPGAGGVFDGYRVDWLRFSSSGDMVVYGWLAVPEVTPVGHRGFVWLPGYSPGNPPPGPESLYPGTVTFGLNLHGHPPDAPYVHPSVLGGDYITTGIDSPDAYILKRLVAHALRALDVLAAQPEVNAERLFVGGMSQGGGLALVAAALSPRVKLCLADMPALCDLDRALSLIDRQRYRRLPHVRIPDARALIEEYADAHPERRAQIFQTYRYFDPLSHAAAIRCPVQMSAGGRDPSCRPPTIFSVFNQLTCEKEMLWLPQTGHEIVPAQRKAHGKWVERV